MPTRRELWPSHVVAAVGRCRPEWIALPGRLFNDSEHGISSVSGETGTQRIYREPSDSWGCSVLCMHIQFVIAVYLRLNLVALCVCGMPPR